MQSAACAALTQFFIFLALKHGIVKTEINLSRDAWLITSPKVFEAFVIFAKKL